MQYNVEVTQLINCFDRNEGSLLQHTQLLISCLFKITNSPVISKIFHINGKGGEITTNSSLYVNNILNSF